MWTFLLGYWPQAIEAARQVKDKYLSDEPINNPASAELQRRQFEGVPTHILNHVATLSPEEYAKLGTPIVTSNGAGGWYCNCKDKSAHIHSGWDNTDCTRCHGYSY